MIQINQLYQLDTNKKGTFINLTHQLVGMKDESIKFILNGQKEILGQLRLSIIKVLENKILQQLLNNQNASENFKNKWNIFQLELQALLLKKDQEFQIYQQIISFIKQCHINEDKITQIIEIWQLKRFYMPQIKEIYQKYNLKIFMNIPGVIQMIGIIVYNLRTLNQFDFFYFLLLIIIKQGRCKFEEEQNVEFENVEQILVKIEEILIHQITNNKNHQNLKVLSQHLDLEDIFQHQHIIDFFITLHFNRYLEMISDNDNQNINNESQVFINIRDQSNIKKLNFILNEFKGSLNYFREKYEINQNYEIRLIKMIQASALIQDFQQEAGNAFTILSYFQSVLWNQDFSKINVANCLLNDIQFFSCNFDSSIMQNASIVSAQFEDCSMQNVFWQNLESSCLYEVRLVESIIFSTHPAILIQLKNNNNDRSILATISFLNLLTGNQRKLFFNLQQGFQPGKQQLKLSCLGQVLVFCNRETAFYWNIQTQKKIRASYSGFYGHKLSSNGQIMAHIIKNQEVNLWKIFEKDCNRRIEKGLKHNEYFANKIKFTKDSKIFIFEVQKKVRFWRVKNGKEICKNIDCSNLSLDQIKFSPDGQLLVVMHNSQLTLWKIQGEKILHIFKQQNIIRAKFSPDQQMLVFMTFQQLFYWKINTQQLTQHYNYLYQYDYDKNYSYQKGHSNNFYQFFDSETLVFSLRNKITFSKLNISNQFQSFEVLSNCETIDISPDKNFVISLNPHNSTSLWSCKNYQKYINGNQNTIWKCPNFLSLSPSSEYLCFAYKHQAIQIRALNDMRVVQEINLEDKKPTSLILSPDFSKFAYCSEGQIVVQRMENEQVIQKQNREKNLKLLQFSPDGEYLVGYIKTSQSNKKKMVALIIWTIFNWEKIFYCQLEEANQHVYSFEFSKQHIQIAIGFDNYIEIDDILNKKSQKLIDDSFQIKINSKSTSTLDSSLALSFSPNGELLASAHNSQGFKAEYPSELRVWSLKDGKITQRLAGCQRQITKIQFLANGIIVSTAKDCSIGVWSIQIGQLVQMLYYHTNKIINLLISSEGSTMITSDDSGLICLWGSKDNPKYSKIFRDKNKMERQDDSSELENSYHFTLCKIIGNPRFRAECCTIDGSKFSSKEGYNLYSVFKENRSFGFQKQF